MNIIFVSFIPAILRVIYVASYNVYSKTGI